MLNHRPAWSPSRGPAHSTQVDGVFLLEEWSQVLVHKSHGFRAGSAESPQTTSIITLNLGVPSTTRAAPYVLEPLLLVRRMS